MANEKQIKARQQQKIDTAANWKIAGDNNFIPKKGEIIVYQEKNSTESKIKIGDGVTPWNDLPYIDGKREISNFDYMEEFPVIGDENVIYKAEKEQSLYQFNADTYEYEKLSDGRGIDDINIINGGKA